MTTKTTPPLDVAAIQALAAEERARIAPTPPTACERCGAPHVPAKGGGISLCSCGARVGIPPSTTLARAALCQLAERLDPAIGQAQRKLCDEARADLASALRERDALRTAVPDLCDALETALAEVALLRAVVDALPRCNCGAPATLDYSGVVGSDRLACDACRHEVEHEADYHEAICDLPHAAALRALLAVGAR